MLEIKNIAVYDLKECVIACRNAMRTSMPEYTDEEFEKSLPRAIKLCKASAESKDVKCHDNFLTGIRVAFDLKYSQYITKQFQRYHWFDYISSSSMLHRLVMMRVDDNCNKYVPQVMVDEEQKNIDFYKKIQDEKISHWIFTLRTGEKIVCTTVAECLYTQFMICISGCPMGYELFVRVDTNYKQLQTIYHQRKNHLLKEDYGEFCKFVENLPYAKEFILLED